MEPHVIEMFSYEWFYMNVACLIALVAFLVLCFLILKSDFIKKNNLESKFTQFLGALILLRLFVSQAYQINQGLWDPNHSLSLHLCGISSILAGICLIRYDQTVYEFLILLGGPGALWSFLTPQMNMYDHAVSGSAMLFTNPGFLYFDYFISHTLILFAPLYLTFLLGKKPRAHSYLKIFYKINFLVIPFVYVVNLIVKSLSIKAGDVNYMYLMYAPKADNPFIIDAWPWYIGVMEIVAFAHMVVIYLMFVSVRKIKSKINIKEKLV